MDDSNLKLLHVDGICLRLGWRLYRCFVVNVTGLARLPLFKQTEDCFQFA
jgi:hypothetical protein